MCSRLADAPRELIFPVVCVAGLCGLRPLWSAAARTFTGVFMSFPVCFPKLPRWDIFLSLTRR